MGRIDEPSNICQLENYINLWLLCHKPGGNFGNCFLSLMMCSFAFPWWLKFYFIFSIESKFDLEQLKIIKS